MQGIRARTLRTITALALGAGALVASAAPARAYDRGTCESAIGSTNVFAVDTIRIDTGTEGHVDFGDDAHWGGTPHGTAVVCWGRNGIAAVIGKLFADGPVGTCVSAQVEFFNSSGVDDSTFRSFCSGTFSMSSEIREFHGGVSNVQRRVRVKLFHNVLQHTSNRYR